MFTFIRMCDSLSLPENERADRIHPHPEGMKCV